MSNLIGFGLIILCGVLYAVTEFVPLLIIMFVGVFLFASFPTEAASCNYIIANTRIALIRKRRYIIFLPFMLVSIILTFGKSILLIPYKEEYFKGEEGSGEELELTKLSRTEYKAILSEQRRIYSTQTLSKEFMETTYSIDNIGLKQKKRRLNLAIFFALLILFSSLSVGLEGIYLALIYEIIFVPMIILWIPDYKDAKILHEAYLRAVNQVG